MPFKSFFVPEGVVREINNETLKFYPTSVKMAVELQAVAAPLLSAIATLSGESFVKHSQEVTKDKHGNSRQVVTVEPSATTVEGHKQLVVRREKALGDLVKNLMRKENAELFAKIIVDSLRDDYPRAAENKTAIQDFATNLDLPTASAFLTALLDANASVFSPFAAKIPGLLRQFLGSPTTGAAEGESPEPPRSPDESSQPSEQPLIREPVKTT
jgi:hypothetical protein